MPKLSSPPIGSCLLEEWPQHPLARKKVTFAELSSSRTYKQAWNYNKSYTSKQIKFFRSQTLRQGLLIQQLVSSLPHPTGVAIQKLLARKVIAREDLLGIEHLVVNKEVSVKMMQDRKTHISLVLEVQQQLHEKNPDSGSCIIELLANESAKSSFNHAEKARLKATFAA